MYIINYDLDSFHLPIKRINVQYCSKRKKIGIKKLYDQKKVQKKIVSFEKDYVKI